MRNKFTQTSRSNANPPALVLALNVQNYCIYNQSSKTQIDTMIPHALSMGVNTIHAGIIDPYNPGVTYYETTGECDVAHVTTFTADGMTPFAYLLQQAHANGIRVFARLYVNTVPYWYGNTSFLLTPFPDDANYHNTTNGGSVQNFANANVRSLTAGFLADFVAHNPTVDGVSLDNCRTDGIVTQTTQELTDFVGAIRAALPSGCILEAVSEAGTNMDLDSPGDGTNSQYAQDAFAWAEAGYLQEISYIGYFVAWPTREYFIDRAAKYKPVVGLSSETTVTTLSTWKAGLLRAQAFGIRRLLLFQYNDQLNNSDFRDAVIAWKAGTLSAPMPDVTAMSVTPGSGWSMTLDGDAYAETNANVSSHTTEGPLKDHYETLVGMELPSLILKRPTTSTIQIHLGDWKYG